MTKKKVLFLIHDLGGGGAEKVLVNLVNHLDPLKYDVHVIALFGGGVNEKRLSSQIHYRSVWPHVIPGSNRFLRRMPSTWLHRVCIKETYDVEIAYLEDVCAKVVSGSRSKGNKTFCWVHSDLQNKRVASRGFSGYKESCKAFESFDGVVCVSETVKADFLKLYPKVKNIYVCYNTLETKRILSLKDEPAIEIERNKDELSLIAVGKICQLKGYDRLVRIIKKLRDNGLNVHFFALGEGPDRGLIEEYLNENDLVNCYTFLGYQENPYKYVAKCDLFVCASHSEGFSTAATEALIVGTPVCTVEVSGMKEMLGGKNEWGIVTKNDEESLYEGIYKLLKNPSLLQHYRKKAEERGMYFSTENTVRAVEEMLLGEEKED